MQDLINFQTRDECTQKSRAWWLANSIDRGNGRIEVARAWAVSKSLRKPAAHELLNDGVLSSNRYDYGPQYTGELVEYMLGLTEQELAETGITPGILAYPSIVDGARPASNRKVVTQAAVDRALDRLQNEGF